MSTIRVDVSRCTLCGECVAACPFDAVEIVQGALHFTEACRLCRICIRRCPQEALALEERPREHTERGTYRDVLIFAEQHEGHVHPVTYELIGKGLELARELGQKLHVVLIGSGVRVQADHLLAYGPATVYVFDHPDLRWFRIEPYTRAVVRVAQEIRPNIMLLGATPIGRSLAPRIAARLGTGLTADCTSLSVNPNGDLVQTRPAFGGNVMAQIVTPGHRPQMATIRYKVMAPARPVQAAPGRVVELLCDEDLLRTDIEVLGFTPYELDRGIEEADVIVAAGRGIGRAEGLALIGQLAELLGGAGGVTRPLVEQGWADHRQQVGMSGRTVRPRLYIACGISGAVQHVAGMRGAEHIVAINTAPEAPIFDVAHLGLVGDLYEIVPKLIDDLKEGAALHGLP